MPFPNQVNVQPGIGVVGDFASGNPRSFIDAGPFGLVSGTQGVAVGRFVWLSYAIGLFLMAQGALGLFRLR